MPTVISRLPEEGPVVQLEKIVGGGQTIGTLPNGKKVFVWGGLPGEKVQITITRNKRSMVEAIVSRVIEPNSQRIEPVDGDSYLSTSPWQIYSPELELTLKAELVDQAFKLHQLSLPLETKIYTDEHLYGYRNKLEFSWYSQLDESTGQDSLDLAFFKRGSRGKVPVDGSSLALPAINQLAQAVRDLLRSKGISARQLKTLLVRCNQEGEAVWQLYTKDRLSDLISPSEAEQLPATGGEVIFSNPKSPASVITERLASFGKISLSDTVLELPFNYPPESFFQINLPVYQQALTDMKLHIDPRLKTVDLYSGVGTIGMTIGGEGATLIEINASAVEGMADNIQRLGIDAQPILAASESSLDYITSSEQLIVDPPRAGLHSSIIDRINQVKPPKVIYLSCNPVTQARDTAELLTNYKITDHRGYNFFPRTPHIEHLVVLERR